MDKCRLHIPAHSLRHNSQFFGLFQPVASVRTRFHCFRFLAPTFCTPFSSSTGMRIPCRSGFFLSCHQSGWDSSTTIFPSVSLTKSQSLTSLLYCRKISLTQKLDGFERISFSPVATHLHKQPSGKWSSTKGCAGTVRALRCQYHHECLCTLYKKSQAGICKVT